MDSTHSSSSPPNYPPPQPPGRSQPPNYPPPPPPLTSRLGAPITAQPGWTLEQSKVFQDLNDRMAKVGQAYGSTIDIANASETQRGEAGRFVQGSPALLNIPDELRQIHESKTFSPQQKEERAKSAFGRVKDLDAFVSGIQQRDYISDDGIRKLPLLSVEETKAFDERKQRLENVLTGVDRRMGMQPPLVLDEKQSVSIQKLANAKPFMEGLPKTLRGFQDNPAIDDTERNKRAGSLKATMTEMDRQMSSMELLMAGHEASVQLAGSPTPNIFRRALTSIQAFGKRVVASLAPKSAEPATPAMPQISIERRPAPPAQTAQSQSQTRGPVSALSIEVGEGAFAKRMGAGVQLGGKVDNVENLDGKTKLSYSFRGQAQSLKVDELDGNGKPNPLSREINELKPGNSFELAISREGNGLVAQLSNHDTGKDAVVRESGAQEHATPVKQLDRGLGR